MNILLIDDDLSVRQALGEALTAENHKVALAASSREADDHLQQLGDREIDAVLLDLCLGPENGWTVCDRLTRRHPHLPVIIMTSSRGCSTAARGRCAAVMEKPLNLHLLFETLRHVTTGSGRSERLTYVNSSSSR